MIVFGDEQHAHAIARKAGVVFNPSCDVVISRTNGAQDLLGGVIFSGFTGASIGMHVAGFQPRWINPDMLWVSFDYPFNQLGVKRVFGQLLSSNQTALDFNLKLGFKEIARIPDVFPDGDMVVMSMRRDECRWLNIKPRGLVQGALESGKQKRSTPRTELRTNRTSVAAAG